MSTVKKRREIRATEETPPAIRTLYEAHGAEGYYREHGGEYQNPHFPEITALIERNFSKIDCSRVLDFAAGGGEVSQVLQRLGVVEITGCDPYTQALYEKNTRRPCLPLSFRDIIKGGLPDSYSAIISSFALHLCPIKELFSLAWALLDAAPLLVILTPHKRPELELLPGIELNWSDAVLTPRGKQVRLKAYRKTAAR